ncbi:hypothetical protein HDU67_001783 [Dinochytrium kinnereticum]|nr:hypothetical protein HDU67_001783 [Dinochytrium kinnereticum]
MAERSRVASHLMQSVTASQKSNSLRAIHAALGANREAILKANKMDMEAAKQEVSAGRLSSSLVKRLDLGAGGDKYGSLLQGVLDVDKLSDPTGKVTLATRLDEGLDLYRVSCPVGVLLIIFEARPEVVVQISCLSIKSGNAVILKGGKEAANSNAALYKVIRDALVSLPEGEGIPVDAVQMVETREDIDVLLKLDRYIDLVIPRGSNQLVRYIQGNTGIPVLGHADGLCSIYLDSSASIDIVRRVVVDSKTSYPAACNSTETLLVNSSLLSSVFPETALSLLESGVRIRADDRAYSTLSSHEKTKSFIGSLVTPICEGDYATEFLDLTIAVKTVESLEEAIQHINTYGSHHTDAIVTEDEASAETFMKKVDAAGVFWNASTRFADGFRYGFGAEIGVSTNKTHARGPVGLEGLVIYKYRLYGKGHVTTDYSSGKRSYLHEPIPISDDHMARFRI